MLREYLFQKFEELHEEEKEKYSKALVAWASSNAEENKPVTARRSKSTSASTQTEDVRILLQSIVN